MIISKIKNRSIIDVYKYKPFNTWAFEMLINDELYLSEPHELNDPNDCAVIVDGSSEKISASVCALTKKYNNYLMWSYYADGHKGLCLKLNYKNLLNSIEKENSLNSQRDTFLLKNVKYLHYSKYRKLVKKHINPLNGDIIIDANVTLLKIKPQNFKHENELRIITKSIDLKKN